MDYEEVKERELPKSIGCSKNFRGKEMLDTRSKVEHWMTNLCTEVAERLVKDQNENDRMAKSLHVSLSQDDVTGQGHLSRCGPLYSYDPAKLTKQVHFDFLLILTLFRVSQRRLILFFWRSRDLTMVDNFNSVSKRFRDHSYITSSHFWDFWTPLPPTSACF